MSCQNPINDAETFLCNINSNASQVFTNNQLNNYDSLSPTQQQQAEAVLQCSASMLLMNMGYNMQYYNSPIYLWESGLSSNLQNILFGRLVGNQPFGNIAQVSMQDLMEILINDPQNGPLNIGLKTSWQNAVSATITNTGYYIKHLQDQALYAMPGIAYAKTSQGAMSDVLAGEVLYTLAGAQVIQCFANPGPAAALISTPVIPVGTPNTVNVLTGFSLSPQQFAPAANLAQFAPAVYSAFQAALSNVNTAQIPGLSSAQQSTLSNMVSVFKAMINSVNNLGIYPLMQLSGLYDLLVYNPNDPSQGADYGINLQYVGQPNTVWAGPCAISGLPSVLGITNQLSQLSTQISSAQSDAWNNYNAYEATNCWWSPIECLDDQNNISNDQAFIQSAQGTYGQIQAVFHSFQIICAGSTNLPGLFTANSGDQYKLFFDSTNFNTAYPSFSGPTSSLYNKLSSTFNPAYTEQTYGLALSQVMTMDIEAQEAAISQNLNSNAQLTILGGIYNQLQTANAALQNIDAQIQQENQQLANIANTLQTIQQNEAQSSSDSSDSGSGFLGDLSDILDICEKLCELAA